MTIFKETPANFAGVSFLFYERKSIKKGFLSSQKEAILLLGQGQKADEEGHEPNEQVAEGAVNEQQEQRIKQGAHDEIPFFIIGQPKNPSFREKHSQ